jgi:beta-phosphoglucomutase
VGVDGDASDGVQAIIFDLDGVLTDTAEFHYLGWKRLADEEGLTFDRQRNDALRGVSRRESLLLVLGGREVDPERFEEMMARKNRYYLELLEGLSSRDALPGAVELVRAAKERGLMVAIGSSSRNASFVLERLGIAGLFDAVADGHSVERAKPAPDLFLRAAELLGVPPASCIVLEDAASGVDAALAAGMVAVGIGPEERVGHGHHRFDATATVDLDLIAPRQPS